jgi:hypothetical protein
MQSGMAASADARFGTAVDFGCDDAWPSSLAYAREGVEKCRIKRLRLGEIMNARLDDCVDKGQCRFAIEEVIFFVWRACLDYDNLLVPIKTYQQLLADDGVNSDEALSDQRLNYA